MEVTARSAATSIRSFRTFDPLEDVHAGVVQGLDDRLEERRPAAAAVATATGGEADRGAAAVQRAAAVTGLGAHVGTDHAGDGALGVADRRVEAGHRAAVDAGGAAAPA